MGQIVTMMQPGAAVVRTVHGWLPIEWETLRWAVSSRNANWWAVLVQVVSSSTTLAAVGAAFAVPEIQRRAQLRDERRRTRDLYKAAAYSGVHLLEELIRAIKITEQIVARDVRPQNVAFDLDAWRDDLEVQASTVRHFLGHELHDAVLVSYLLRAIRLTERTEGLRAHLRRTSLGEVLTKLQVDYTRENNRAFCSMLGTFEGARDALVNLVATGFSDESHATGVSTSTLKDTA